MPIVSSVVDGPNIRAGLPAGFGDGGSLRPGHPVVIGRKAERVVTIR
jgi:hypothetical protein